MQVLHCDVCFPVLCWNYFYCYINWALIIVSVTLIELDPPCGPLYRGWVLQPGFCPCPYCTYEWGWTGSFNLMHVNCLIPRLRSSLLSLLDVDKRDRDRRDRATKSQGIELMGERWSRVKRKVEECEKSGAAETERRDAVRGFIEPHLLLLFKHVMSFNI